MKPHSSCVSRYHLVLVLFAALAVPAFGQSPAPAPAVAQTSAPPVILTPPPPDTPRINGPKVFGVRPGSVFLYAIPATGQRPMQFSADHLPDGLKLDGASGEITGTAPARGDY